MWVHEHMSMLRACASTHCVHLVCLRAHVHVCVCVCVCLCVCASND